MIQTSEMIELADGRMITCEKDSVNTTACFLDMLVTIAKIGRERNPGTKIKNSSMYSENLIKLMDLHSKHLKEISERME